MKNWRSNGKLNNNNLYKKCLVQIYNIDMINVNIYTRYNILYNLHTKVLRLAGCVRFYRPYS